MNYTDYVTALSTLTVISSTNADFLVAVPLAIQYAEGLIYRDLDMLNLEVRDSSSSTSAGDRNFNLPTSVGFFQVVTQVNVITPAGTAPEAGIRNPATPVSQSVLDWIYPSVSGSGLPQFFAYISQSSISGQKNIILGPWPDAAYRVEVAGKIQWTPLSASNPTTFLSLYLPDLLIAASMIFMSGYKGNYGAASDDPRAALGWTQQYQSVLQGASTAEALKRHAGASWTAKAVEPTAQAQRG